MRAYTDIGGLRFGFESNRVHVGGEPYVDRWILYLGWINLRLHRFWRGDDERAPHDHPWGWWVTFPFTGYYESVDETWRVVSDGTTSEVKLPEPDVGFCLDDVPTWRPSLIYPTGMMVRSRRINYVRPWRFHYRLGTYRHIVIGSSPPKKSWWTFVIAGQRTRMWGFYPPGKPFVPWTEWV